MPQKDISKWRKVWRDNYAGECCLPDPTEFEKEREQFISQLVLDVLNEIEHVEIENPFQYEDLIYQQYRHMSDKIQQLRNNFK